MKKAYAPFELKAVDEQGRTFTGLASTWALDLDGDIIQKGAFAKTLDDWRSSAGRRIIPLLDQHNYSSARSVIGRAEQLEETPVGLSGTWSIVESADGNEFLARIKGGYLNALSIGFQTIQAHPEEREIDGGRRTVKIIRELKLHEISAVIFAANPSALIDRAAALKFLYENLDYDPGLELPLVAVPPDNPERLAAEALIRELRLAAIGGGRSIQ